jgi:hypothetical protein
MKKLTRIILYLWVLLFMASCSKKNKEADLKPDLNVANDAVIAGSAFNYIFNMVVKAQSSQELMTNHVALIDSAYVVYSTGESEFVFTFNGKMSSDSVRRTGKFEAEFDSSFIRPGSTTMILFDSYYDGYDLVNGMDSIVCNGINSSNKMQFTDYVKHGLVLKGLADNAVISYSSETQYLTDADAFTKPGTKVFLVNGNCSGVSSKQYGFSGVIDSLTDNTGCPWILDGTINLTIPNADYTKGTIDFLPGDGCSNKLKYNFEGNIFYLWDNAAHLNN